MLRSAVVVFSIENVHASLQQTSKLNEVLIDVFPGSRSVQLRCDCMRSAQHSMKAKSSEDT